MLASADEPRIATIATGGAQPPGNQALPALSEPSAASVSPGADIAGTKIATLGGPAVSIETPPAKVSAKPDQSALKNRQQAKRAVQRRRLAVRARVAAQAPLQPVSPFGQPTPTIRNR
jgi:hypothetical protein